MEMTLAGKSLYSRGAATLKVPMFYRQYDDDDCRFVAHYAERLYCATCPIVQRNVFSADRKDPMLSDGSRR